MSANIRLIDEPRKIMKSMRRATAILLSMANSLDLAKCREGAEAIRSHCADRRPEELDESDRFAFELAHIRIEQESSHVRRIRGRVELYTDRDDDKGEAARITVATADLMLAELGKAHAVSFEGRKSECVCTDALDDITLPDPHAETDAPKMTSAIKTSDLLGDLDV